MRNTIGGYAKHQHHCTSTEAFLDIAKLVIFHYNNDNYNYNYNNNNHFFLDSSDNQLHIDIDSI